MAKMNPNLAKAAKMSGVKMPSDIKVPKKPKMPAGAIKTPEQLKKQAKERAKKRMKVLIRVLIVAAVAAIVGGIVYFVKFYDRMPKDAFSKCVEYAYRDNTVKFRECFTTDTIGMVESTEGSHDDEWEHLMDGITPSKRPEITDEDITEENGIRSAELAVNIDGEQRSVFMREEEGSWKINLNVAINPRKISLPEDIPPEYIDNFDTSDEPEAWWEEEAEEKKAEKEKGGFFAKIKKKLFK